MKFASIIPALVLAVGFSAAVVAGEPPAAVSAALAELVPDRQPDAVKKSALPGLYEVRYGPEVFYLSGDGRYVVQGDVIDVASRENLTEQGRAAGRLALLSTLDEKQMIVFAPEHPRHTITVFTDVDCAYCRKLHSQMAEYNAEGIAVHYLAYPRAGMNSQSYWKMVSVWCAEDRAEAMTLAKRGKPTGGRRCDNPIAQHLAVAGELGVNATPTIILEDGTLFAGYVPPRQMAELLDRHAATRLGALQ